MAYYHARSGVCRSDAVHSGLYTRGMVFTIGGTVRTSRLKKEGFSLTDTLDEQPSTLTLWTRGFVPTLYHEVVARNGGANGVVMFRGRLMNIRTTAVREADDPTHKLTVRGDHWLMDRFARVNAVYYGKATNEIVAHILANFTNGSPAFRVGSIPFDLGPIDRIEFKDELVSQAITRVLAATATTAVWRLSPQHKVSATPNAFFDGNPLTLDDGDVGHWDFTVEDDGEQIRTRSTYEGEFTMASETVDAGASVVPVDETALFAAGGGLARSTRNIITYGGLSVASGPGNLTGCSGITESIAQGDLIHVYALANNTTAQTVLATALGGGLSGIATDAQSNSDLSLTECEANAARDVEAFGTQTYAATYTTRNEFSKVGKLVAVNVTKPHPVVQNIRIRAVTITPRGRFDASTVNWDYAVDAGAYRRLATQSVAAAERGRRL
jgi:hypothetical protein